MGRPRLPRITPEDLTDLDRLLSLFDRATSLDLVDGSEAARLTFVATAIDCLQAGKNPCALFAFRVREGKWLVSQSCEDQARRQLRTHLYGERTASAKSSQPKQSNHTPKYSSDVELLQSVLASVPSARDSRGVCFSACKRIDPTWTEERQERAERECNEHH
ncbi:MAG: hypothetical protein ACPGXK_00075 [Phycisphaerae bacterium]